MQKQATGCLAMRMTNVNTVESVKIMNAIVCSDVTSKNGEDNSTVGK